MSLERDHLLRDSINKCASFRDFELLLETRAFKPGGVLFIDEAQESTKLGQFVRFTKEAWKDSSVILSGSSMSRLFSGHRVPVGRVEYLRVYPLSFQEFLRASNADHYHRELLQQKLRTSESLHRELITRDDKFLKVGGLQRVVISYVQGEPEQTQNNLRYEIFLSQREDF